MLETPLLHSGQANGLPVLSGLHFALEQNTTSCMPIHVMSVSVWSCSVRDKGHLGFGCQGWWALYFQHLRFKNPFLVEGKQVIIRVGTWLGHGMLGGRQESPSIPAPHPHAPAKVLRALFAERLDLGNKKLPLSAACSHCHRLVEWHSASLCSTIHGYVCRLSVSLSGPLPFRPSGQLCHQASWFPWPNFCLEPVKGEVGPSWLASGKWQGSSLEAESSPH